MMKRMATLLLALLLIASVSLAEGAEPVKLSIIYEHTETTAEVVASSRMFLKAQEEFLASHPEITMEITALGSSTELWDKLAVLAASNDLPDIIYMDSKTFNIIASEGMLADLTGATNPALYRDNLETYSQDGKVYGLPVKATTYNYVYYNPEIWAKADYEAIPTTWDEFIKACEAVRALGVTPVSFGNKTLWNVISNYFNALVYETCGQDWVNGMAANDGSAAYTDACFVEALDILKAASATWNVDFNTADDQWAVGEYAKGNAAAHISGSWVAGSIKSYEADYPGISEKTRVARVPTISGGDPVITFALPQALGVNVKLQGRELEAAIEYVKYLAGDSYSKHMAEIGEMGPMPVNVDLSSLLPMQQDLFAVMNAYENVPQFSSLVTPSETSAVQAAVSSFLSGAVAAEDAAAEMQAAVPVR